MFEQYRSAKFVFDIFLADIIEAGFCSESTN